MPNDYISNVIKIVITLGKYLREISIFIFNVMFMNCKKNYPFTIKKVPLLFFLTLLLLNINSAFGQSGHSCGFDIMHKQKMLSDKAYDSSVTQLNRRWIAYSKLASSALLTYTSSGYVYEIPMVVHVLHTGGTVGSTYNPDSATLAGMVEYLNKSYAAVSPFPDTTSGGTRIPLKFVLAKRTPSGASTNGIIRINASTALGTAYTSNGLNASGSSGVSDAAVAGLSRWNSADYYNVYVVNKIDGNDLTSTGGIAGFAYFPGYPKLDGMYVVASQAKTGSTTVSHEFGHAFSLYHTFEGDAGGTTCPSTSSCSTTGDLVCDTEPHIRESAAYPSTWCPPTGATNSCTGVAYAGVQKNIMDYTNCPPDRFTGGQRTRVLNTLDNERTGYKSSLGLQDPSGTVTAACMPTFSNPRQAVGPYIVDFNGLNVWTGSAQDEDTNYVDHSYTQQSFVTKGTAYTINVTTKTNKQNVKVFIDYNNDGDFADAGENVFSHSGTTTDEVHSGSFTIPSSVTTCAWLRMRVVAEFYGSSVSDYACGSLAYGQVEDYAVYVKSDAPTATSPISYTVGAAASPLTATGTGLKWYTASSGGTGSSTAITPSTASAGTTIYYVSQSPDGTSNCESARTPISVIVTASTGMPTVSTPVNYCKGAVASALTASLASSTDTLYWYTVATGGVGSKTAPTPLTTTVGTTTYYVSEKTTSGTESNRDSIKIIVNPLPSISGTFSACIGATPTLTGSASPHGTTPWASSNTAVATISSSGVITALTAGTTTITYKNTNGCDTSISFTVNALPTISGTASACVGLTSTLTGSGTADATTPWASSNTGVATVSTSGLVTGVAAGTATITYKNSLGCTNTVTFTVNALPTISGTASACIGLTSTLSGSGTPDATTPWTSSSTGVATVSSSGVVTAVAAGTTTITYKNSLGCSNTTTFTVNALPTISGTASACPGSTSTLSGSGTPDATTPWASSNTSVATVSSGGVVTGVAAGTATITYKNSLGCSNTTTFTVNALPTISGTLSICIGDAGPTLTGSGTADATTPWTSSNTAVATISSTGVITPVATGTTTITYKNSIGCSKTATFAINSLPTISGTLTICNLATTTLSGTGSPDATTPWTSSATAVATISSTGVVTGVSAGTTTITYKNSNGCTKTATVTVNALPTISGTLSACIGATSTLTGSATADTTTPWASSNTAVATVSSTGVVTGVAAGTTTITYKNLNKCTQTATFTVNALPTISGTLSACAGLTSTLTGSGTADATTPWSSSTTSVATISSTGVVTAVAGGTTTITYKNSLGCTATATFTVNALPTITGTLSICIGDAGPTLTGSGTPDATTPWTSATTTVATISSTGVVSPVASATGTTVISYKNSLGCIKTATFAVNPLPTITGTLSVCIAATTTLTGSATAHATTPWTSSNTAVATVSSTGVVTGVAVGTTTITYRNTNGCTTTANVTVNDLPTVSGTLVACVGGTSTLTGSATAATSSPWTSSSTSVATVSSTGVVTAVAGGTTTITYKNSNNCTKAVTFTVNPLPTISGTLNTCVGFTSTLTGSATADATTPWKSSNTARATVSSTGVVTGVSAGTATITYRNANGCEITATFTVNPIPAAPTVVSPIEVCLKTSEPLTATGTNLKWYTTATSTTSTPTMTPNTTATGSTNYYVSQTTAAGCESPRAVINVTVNPLPVVDIKSKALSSGFVFCRGKKITLWADAPTGKFYQWSFETTVLPGATADTILADTTGRYIVEVTDAKTCKNKDTVYAQRDTNEVPAMSPTTAYKCEESEVLLTVNPGYVGWNFEWKKDGVVVLHTTPTENLKNVSLPGIYTVVVTNPLGCVDTTNPANVINYPRPTKPVLTLSGAELSVANIYVYYQWYKGAAPLVGANANKYTPLTTGDYWVEVTDANGCLNQSDTMNVKVIPNGIGNVAATGKMRVFPNPTTGLVHIEAPKNINVIVTDVVGRVILKQDKATHVDISQYADGTYFFRLMDEQNNLISVEKINKTTAQ